MEMTRLPKFALVQLSPQRWALAQLTHASSEVTPGTPCYHVVKDGAGKTSYTFEQALRLLKLSNGGTELTQEEAEKMTDKSDWPVDQQVICPCCNMALTPNENRLPTHGNGVTFCSGMGREVK